MNIHIFWIWLALGLMFLTVEYFAKGLVFLWAGISALVVGLVAWRGVVDSGIGQSFLFAILSIGSVIAWRHRNVVPRDLPARTLPVARNDSYKGRIFTLDTPIKNGIGDLRIDDVRWRLSGPDLSKGSRICVLNSDGGTLNVNEFVESSFILRY